MPLFQFFFIKILFISIFLLLSYQKATTQPLVFAWDKLNIVIESHKPLRLAWAGGLNAPQVQKIDLDNDKKLDLVLFDRTNAKVFTFLAMIKDGIPFWEYAPDYEVLFPPLQAWVLLRDYDDDGRKDIFTHAAGGIAVYKNIAHPNNPKLFGWKKITTELNTLGLASEQVNLQVAPTDIPCIQDLDGDKDLDVITFDFAQGSLLELHLNQTKNLNIISLERQGFCWANLWEGRQCGDIRLDYECYNKKNKGGG